MKNNYSLFDSWNQEKKHINKYGSTGKIKDFYINYRDVWYIKLGINVGYEQNGKTDFKRAVLVIKKIGNIFLVIPMTTKEKNNIYHYKLKSFKGKISWLILSQLRTVDKKRFIKKIGEISAEEFKIIKKNLSKYYFSDL
ncbi:MAG: type II toxin-antitoxin system PemK/MazF family toxin [Candidatus Absconditabacteria bacterium]|nr:type II toxin-antitoxin system PemK/MazF family toxin [Candidatus Absconditabacteria bacterium]